jgi:hypothetical protein
MDGAALRAHALGQLVQKAGLSAAGGPHDQRGVAAGAMKLEEVIDVGVTAEAGERRRVRPPLRSARLLQGDAPDQKLYWK